MLDKSHSERIVKKALAASVADHTEIVIGGGKNALTRFANNGIHQNVMQKDYSLTVKATFGKKSGIAKSNLFSGENLMKTVERACAIARHSDEDPDFLPPVGPQEYRPMEDAYVEDTIDCTPQMRADMVARAVDRSKKKGFIASGTVVTGDHMVFVANSAGLQAYHSWTNSSFTLTITNPEDGTAWAENVKSDVADLDIDNLSEKAVRIASLNRRPITIDQGEYDVLVEPDAVSNMVMFLAFLGFSAQDYVEGRSFLRDKLGTKVTGENFSVRDDAYDPAAPGIPFDYDGIPRLALPLIENGVAKNLVHDRRTAVKMNTNSTGHATHLASTWGPITSNLIVPGGTVPRDEMLKTLGNGLYICNFFYDNVVDPMKTRITGMTRDGFFVVKNGEIVDAIGRMRYNISLIDVFSRITAMSKETKTFERSIANITVPSMIMKGFRLTP